MVGNGTGPTFGLWYDFRQKSPPGDYARFYDMRLFASRVAPRVRDAVKV